MINDVFLKLQQTVRADERVMVTGGAGYIGSHTCLALLQAGFKVVVVDNLCNSFKTSIRRVRHLAECEKDDLIFVKVALQDRVKLEEVFNKYKISTVVHFAGLKAVAESIELPLEYYLNNVTATCVLLECMKKYGCRRLVFSSSATVYGNAKDDIIKETAPTRPLTPYGWSKLMCEQVIADVCHSPAAMSAIVLRYFNPVGCHPSGLLGENPRNAPNNLMPCVTEAMFTKKPMSLFGDDYETPDGTTIRDFIHVMDLADGHVQAVRKLLGLEKNYYYQVFNMGNGVGSSVRQVFETMERITGIPVPHVVAGRRSGDAMRVVADPSKANRELGWKSVYGLDSMCATAWKSKEMTKDGSCAGKKSMWRKKGHRLGVFGTSRCSFLW